MEARRSVIKLQKHKAASFFEIHPTRVQCLNKKGRGETAPTFLSLVILCQYIRGQCASYLAVVMHQCGFGSAFAPSYFR